MKPAARTRIIFVTGTDTGVGKTVLTSLLIAYLRQTRSPAAALKPFCSGPRSDAEILYTLQQGDLTLDQINPWFFPEPLAPFVTARMHRKRITLDSILNYLQEFASSLSLRSVVTGKKAAGPPAPKTDPILLIEGAGGLLVPLGERFTALDLIRALGCQVLVVATNRLGTINHTLLTLNALNRLKLPCRVVLMETANPDLSAASNPRILRELLVESSLFGLPFLGPDCLKEQRIRAQAKRLHRNLREILRADIGQREYA